MLKSEIEFWKNVIISNKRVEPRSKSEEAAYDIAEYYLSLENEKVAA